MHSVNFLYDLATVMIVAGLVTIVFHRFRQPVVLGYILAGMIIGPLSPRPLIQNEETINTLSELGVIFLLFSLGLEFSLRKLKRVGTASAIAATIEILVLLGAGYFLGRVFGWSPMDSLFLGAMISISSTTITVKALGELGRTRERFASIIFGILIVEDIYAIILIALLSGIAQSGALQTTEAALTVGRLAVFLVTSLVLGFIAVPRLVGYVARFKRDEMLLITVLGLCFGYCFLALRLGYSVALGAFLMGLLVSEAREIGRIETLIRPVRDMFIAVFFVSVGLLIQPGLVVEYAWPILAVSLLVVAGKFATCAVGAFIPGNDIRTSVQVGMGKAQIGEFSFIMAGLGLTYGVTEDFLFPVAVSVSVLTTLLTPYLIRASDAAGTFAEERLPRTVHSYLNLYSRWVRQLQEGSRDSHVQRILRRILGQLAIFGLMNAGALLVAVFLARMLPLAFPELAEWRRWINTALWLVAMVLSMPVILATFRKLKALGMILAEIGIPGNALGPYRADLRAIVANSVLVAGMSVQGLVIFLLSSAILPQRHFLPVLGAMILLLAYWLRDSFNKIYFQGKAALTETFNQHLLDTPHEKEKPRTSIISEAHLDTVLVQPNYPCAGKLIRETQLRQRTGASIVGIEREESNILNPGPDEDLLPGDRILLLGSESQLRAAREYLGGLAAPREVTAGQGPPRKGDVAV